MYRAVFRCVCLLAAKKHQWLACRQEAAHAHQLRQQPPLLRLQGRPRGSPSMLPAEWLHRIPQEAPKQAPQLCGPVTSLPGRPDAAISTFQWRYGSAHASG